MRLSQHEPSVEPKSRAHAFVVLRLEKHASETRVAVLASHVQGRAVAASRRLRIHFLCAVISRGSSQHSPQYGTRTSTYPRGARSRISRRQTLVTGGFLRQN